MTTYNTIMLVSNPPNPVIYEKVALEAFSPGHLVELDSNDEFGKHATAGGNVAPILFALEDDLQGDDIDDEFSDGDKARAWQPLPGDQVYAFLADGQNVSKNDLLESNGAGALTAYVADSGTVTVYPNQIVAKADEALNPTSGDARILVTIV